MPFLEHENFMEQMKKLAEVLPSEEAVDVVQNLTDTYTEMEGRITQANNKLTESDNNWRKKYFDTFFADRKSTTDPDPEGDQKPKQYKFENLFKEEK